MDLTEYISVSGQGGLFKVIAKSTNGLIVESLTDQKRTHVHASQKVSALQDISIFTTSEDMPLSQVFQNIYEKEKGGAAIDHKEDGTKLKKYFEQVLPEYDTERVYASDIKKVLQWYNLLQGKGLLKPEEKESSEEAVKEEAAEANGEKASKPKTAKSKEEKATKTTAKAKSAKTVTKTKETTPKASTKAKGGKTQTVRKTGA